MMIAIPRRRSIVELSLAPTLGTELCPAAGGHVAPLLVRFIPVFTPRASAPRRRASFRLAIDRRATPDRHARHKPAARRSPSTAAQSSPPTPPSVERRRTGSRVIVKL